MFEALAFPTAAPDSGTSVEMPAGLLRVIKKMVVFSESLRSFTGRFVARLNSWNNSTISGVLLAAAVGALATSVLP